MNRNETIIAVSLAAIMLFGMGMSFWPTAYHCEIDAWADDSGIHYGYSANFGVETHTAVIRTSGEFDISDVYAYYDERYAALNPWWHQDELLRDLDENLEIRSMNSISYADADELLDVMASADTNTTAIVFVSGALPVTVYDGTPDCALIDWLKSGGTVISISTCLGKYVSHGPDAEDIEVVSGFASLIAGSESVSDSDFNDVRSSVRTGYAADSEIQDALGIYLNEYSYGIMPAGLGQYLSIGGRTLDGMHCAVLYRSYGGMVMNFGATITNHPHTLHFIAQTIASGLDCTASIVEYASGNTYGDASGSFDVSGGDLHLYGYAGATRAVYGEKVTFPDAAGSTEGVPTSGMPPYEAVRTMSASYGSRQILDPQMPTLPLDLKVEYTSFNPSSIGIEGVHPSASSFDESRVES